METLSYCQLMERCLAAEARVVELTAENVGMKEAMESEKRICATWRKTAESTSEKLEKTQQRIIRLEKDNQKLCAANVTLNARAELVESWLEEMESRTVKMPQRHSMLLRKDFNEDYHTEMAYKVNEVQAALTEAGIKWEVE